MAKRKKSRNKKYDKMKLQKLLDEHLEKGKEKTLKEKIMSEFKTVVEAATKFASKVVKAAKQFWEKIEPAASPVLEMVVSFFRGLLIGFVLTIAVVGIALKPGLFFVLVGAAMISMPVFFGSGHKLGV